MVAITLVFFIAATLGVVLYFKKNMSQENARAARGNPTTPAAPEPDPPIPFGSKTTWIAIRTEKTQEVSAALGLEETTPANWKNGLRDAYGTPLHGTVFVSPPVVGWTFIIGGALPQVSNGIALEDFEKLVGALCGHFPAFSYYATHSTTDVHAWVLVEQSQIKRGYAYIGPQDGAAYDVGTPTPEEVGFRFRFDDVDTVSKLPASEPPSAELWRPVETDVFKIAEKWSLNPTLLGQENALSGLGLTGRLPPGVGERGTDTALHTVSP